MRGAPRLHPRTPVAVFGLTGSIASGKSELARELGKLGAAVVDADEVAHSLLRRGLAARREIAAMFGSEVLRRGGGIDRDRLGEVVFADPQARSRLEALLHPLILGAIKRRIRRLARAGARVVIVEAALIFETGLERQLDGTIAVVARRSAQVRRLGRQRGIGPDQALARIGAQQSPGWKARRADWVVRNDSTLAELSSVARRLWGELLDHPATRIGIEARDRAHRPPGRARDARGATVRPRWDR